ncbi:MAG: sulfite dehydrogenase [Planctomycetota bacterium]|jgi:cytochrome c6
MARLSLLTRLTLVVGSLLLPAFALTACGPAAPSESALRGRKVFMESSQPKCFMCHQLRDAGSPKGLGPDLDMLRPSREKTIKSVTQGVGIMPAQKGILTPQEIEDVAAYLEEVAGR